MPTPDLTTLKKALKIDYSTDDAELIRIRDAAVAFIEDYCGVSINTESQTIYLPYWVKYRFEKSPFMSVESVKYYDSSNALTTMPTTDYFIIRSQSPSIYINFKEFPSVYEDTEIEVTYNSGYDELPEHIIQAIIAITGAWYNNPEATAPITLSEVPLSARFILENIKVKGTLE